MEVKIDGSAVAPPIQYESTASGSVPFSDTVALTATEVSQMTVGSFITVTGWGSGIAIADPNECLQ